ncbi:MAG: 50S ribosomal protein L29 [bacterium]|nr:50S ribosomal protein L29 [bacterium]
MDFKELQTKSETELRKILGQNREKLRELRFKDSNKQLKNIREIRTVKEQVAHVLTILNKKK